MFTAKFFYSAIVYLDLFFLILVIFFERKNASSTIAWILILIFVPILGFVGYLFLGSGFHINKKKKFAFKAAADCLYKNQILRVLGLKNKHNPEKFLPKYTRLLHYLSNEGESLYTGDNKASIFTDGNVLFPDMIAELKKAKHHIHLAYYIFRNDRLGKEIIEVLEEKAAAGVEIRIIYDSLGSLLSLGGMFKKLHKAGGKTVAFSPVFFSISSQFRLNYRNHRKITVVDGLVAYLGGMNIGVEYLGENKKLTPWRDTQLKVVGSGVHFIQERFIVDWCYVSKTSLDQFDTGNYFLPPTEKGTTGLQIVSSGPDTAENPIKNGFLEMIYSAQKSVYIQTPYFVPVRSLITALNVAAKSGIDVRLMVPNVADYWLVYKATMGFIWEALQVGVKVYKYNGFMHSKTIVCDGTVASIGSTNFNNRSFTLDFEINAFIYDQKLAQEYENIFYQDQKNSTEVSLEWFQQKSFLSKRLYNVTRLFAPMM